MHYKIGVTCEFNGHILYTRTYSVVIALRSYPPIINISINIRRTNKQKHKLGGSRCRGYRSQMADTYWLVLVVFLSSFTLEWSYFNFDILTEI